MKTVFISEGMGRERVSLSTQMIGKDLVVFIFNGGGHLGAVAVADYSPEEDRTSTSVITRLGHKDDSVAYDAAYKLCKRFKKPVCAIAGIHLDNITDEEIAQITQNCEKLVDKCSRQLAARRRKPTGI
jgi:hypothetical protein